MKILIIIFFLGFCGCSSGELAYKGYKDGECSTSFGYFRCQIEKLVIPYDGFRVFQGRGRAYGPGEFRDVADHEVVCRLRSGSVIEAEDNINAGHERNIAFNAEDCLEAPNTSDVSGHIWVADFSLSAPREDDALMPTGSGWVATSLTNAPLRTSASKALWAQGKLFRWGGNRRYLSWQDDVIDKVVFDPSTNSWESIAQEQQPAWKDQDIVWTGAEVIVWGNSTVGGRYDMEQDTWSPISEIEAPKNDATQNALWTGHKMFLWDVVSNGGSFYDPAADVWSRISATDAPKLKQASVTLLDEKVLIWGVEDTLFADSQEKTAGAVYDLNADTWQTIATENSPSLRENFTMVSTGSSAIIWGGTHDNEVYHDGRIYNEATGIWKTISNLNAPSPRAKHSAVWTGAKMMIWGGYTIDNDSGKFIALGDGGLYDPVTDTWEPIAANSYSPHPRFEHSAVWTGEKMIIWGGTTSLDRGNGLEYRSLNTGGIYTPE